MTEIRYEKISEVRERISDDELAKLVENLPTYEREFQVCELHNRIKMSPQITVRYGDLAMAIMEVNPNVIMRGFTLVYVRDQSELEEAALQSEASRAYYAARKEAGL